MPSAHCVRRHCSSFAASSNRTAIDLGSQVLLFNNRVIFSFYQMRPGTQTVLKAVVLIILVDGTAATTTYLAVRARLTGTMSYDEYACYLVRIGTPQSSSGYSGIAVTLPMTVVVVGMAVIFIYAFTGFVEFKRSTGKKESLKTLYLALLSFGSSAINQVMNTMDQMNMLAGLSAFRQIQKVLDSIIALTLALMVHRNIVARASRTADVRRLSKAHVAKPLQQASVQRSVTVNAGHPCIPHEPADAVNKMSIQWR